MSLEREAVAALNELPPLARRVVALLAAAVLAVGGVLVVGRLTLEATYVLEWVLETVVPSTDRTFLQVGGTAVTYRAAQIALGITLTIGTLYAGGVLYYLVVLRPVGRLVAAART